MLAFATQSREVQLEFCGKRQIRSKRTAEGGGPRARHTRGALEKVSDQERNSNSKPWGIALDNLLGDMSGQKMEAETGLDIGDLDLGRVCSN